MPIRSVKDASVSPNSILPGTALAEALIIGQSMMVTSEDETSSLVADAARLLAGQRVRVLRVTAPLSLHALTEQVGSSVPPHRMGSRERAFQALTVLDETCDRIALLIDCADRLPQPTLRYIDLTMRASSHLQLILVGAPGVLEMLAAEEFTRLRARITVQLSFPDKLHGSGVISLPSRIMSTRTPGDTHEAAPTMLEDEPAPAPRRARSATLGWVVAVGVVCLVPLVGYQMLSGRRSAGPPAGIVAPAATPAAVAVAVPTPLSPPATPPYQATTVTDGPTQVFTAADPEPPATTRNVTSVDQTVSAAASSVASADQAVSATASSVASVDQAAPAMVEPSMMPLAGGEFRMGSGTDPSERPAHTAAVAPFLLGAKAVSVREWQRCVDAKACVAAPGSELDSPVTNVSWDDARGYVAWLSTATGYRYRLPTEAEWEYAARAGAATRYAWGDAMIQGLAACKGCGTPLDMHNPPRVDAFPPNAFGLYGMGGGAAEWVSDCWHRNYGGAPRNGSVSWDSPDCRERVLRGGSWMEDAASIRVSNRYSYDASVRYPTHGFRVARSE